MHYPKLKRLKEKISVNNAFGGIKHTESVPEGRFYDMENLSVSRFPLMSVRPKRAVWTGVSDDDTAQSALHTGVHRYYDGGITAVKSVAGHFIVCSSRYIFVDGRRLNGCILSTDHASRDIIPMGNEILIMPDGIILKLKDDGGYSYKEISVCYGVSSVKIFYCDISGAEIKLPNATTRPKSPSAGDRYAEAEGSVMYLSEYTDKGIWEKKDRLYIGIDGFMIENHFSEGDYIFVPFPCIRNGECRIVSVGTDKAVCDGILDSPVEELRNFSAEKKPPVMDMTIEHNNRIWGCRYGTSNTGVLVNEIYASAPGEPGEWYRFEGTSMDSYRVSLGCSGEFTGVAVRGNDILFFKEEYIIRVSGATPSDFSVRTYPLPGVEKGSRHSVVNINDKIFYKSKEGIMCYDGTYPVKISADLGSVSFRDGVSECINGKYYTALTDENGHSSILVYDTSTGFWFRENDAGKTCFIVRHKGCLFFVTRLKEEDGYKTYSFYLWDENMRASAPDILGTDNSGEYEYLPEDRVLWYAESGKLGESTLPERQILRSILITLSLDEDSYVDVSIIPEGAEEKIRLCTVDPPRKGAFSIPVSTPPCHSFRLIFEGKGNAVIYSVVKKCEITGEVRNYGTR